MSMRAVLLGSWWLLLAGCPGSPPPAPPSGEPTPAPMGEAPPGEAQPGKAAQRPAISAEQCKAEGGTVVGDIGDGAIHRAEYTCPSGSKPTGTIAPPDGGPVPIEGAVCCPK